MMEDAIELFELNERISKTGSGRRYFTGILNGCRVVALQNENVRPDEGVEAVWSLFIQPGNRGLWKHTDEGRANAEARQRNIERVKAIADDADR